MLEFISHYIFLPLFILAIIIFIHEIGHFCVARYFKIFTPVFSVGFGKEIIGYSDKHGTRWKLCWFPLGGYVSVNSQDSDPLYQRTFIALGGPVANFLLAILIMIVLGVGYGYPSTPSTIVALNTKAGAYAAGMQPLDKIISLDGQKIPYHMDNIKEIIENSKNEKVIALINRNGKEIFLSIDVRSFPKDDDFGTQKQHKMMGVVFAGQNWKLRAINSVDGVETEGQVDKVREELIKNFGKYIIINFGLGADRAYFYTFVDADLNKGLRDPQSKNYASFILWDQGKTEYRPITFFESLKESIKLVYEACRKTLGVFYQIVVGKKDTGDLGGVIAISNMTGEVADDSKEIGLYFVFKFVALLSISIGFINLFPFPLLDGGHLMFYAMEAVRGKPPSLRVKGYIYGVGIMFLLILYVMVAYRDIVDRLAS